MGITKSCKCSSESVKMSFTKLDLFGARQEVWVIQLEF